MKEGKHSFSNRKNSDAPEILKKYEENYGYGRKMKLKERNRENNILRKKILEISSGKIVNFKHFIF